MKLLWCRECSDVVALGDHERACECGETKGQYLDQINAEYSGPCEPFALSNTEFIVAVHARKPDKLFPFFAWVTPLTQESFRRIDGTVSLSEISQA